MHLQNNITEIEEFNRINGTDLPAKPLYKVKCVQFQTDMTDFIMTPTDFKKSILVDSSSLKTQILGKSVIPEKSDEEKKLEYLERSKRRSRQQVQYKVRQIGANHLLTLTTRESLSNEDFIQAFNKFIRLVREKILFNGELISAKEKNIWSYVAVPELQERGAWHIHLAVVGKQDLNFLRACWYTALGGKITDKDAETKGAINVQSRKKRFSGNSKIFKVMQLVGYLTKYISKSFDDDEALGKARYKASRDIKQPVTWRKYLSQTVLDGNSAFTKAMQEVIQLAKSQGVIDFEIFNVGTDVFVLRGMFDRNSLFV